MLYIKGANGVGKTTLFKLIAGLQQPTQGQIIYLGRSINDDLSLYHQQLCYVGHKAGISPFLSIKEHCRFEVKGGGQKNVQDLVSVFGLQSHLDSPCGLLSAGQKRQVSLLRLWQTDAPLWLLDEPFIALDKQSTEVLMRQIEVHRAKGGAVVLTSHQNLPADYSSYQEYCL